VHRRELLSANPRALGVVLLAFLSSGCLLDRSGTGLRDAAPPSLDAGAGVDAGRSDAGHDAGVDSAVPIPDSCVATMETCNGLDDDCDGIADDELTRMCGNACGTGVETCTLGTWGGCTVPEPETEVCDNIDNNCNGLIDDDVTRPCSNDCGEGLEACTGGVWGACSVGPPEPELCDNVDNDCNGMVDEMLSLSCTATSGCGPVMGTSVCVGGTYGPCDALLPAEVCNGVDDDCNGTIDDGAGCPCILRHLRGSAYLFCTARESWTGAQAACRALGYELITINDSEENIFARQGLGMDLVDDWWIGVSDRATEGTWVWSFGSSSFSGWASGEPNASNRAHDCGAIEDGSNGFEDYGEWSDHTCSENNPYVCESR